jgi:hypothetical protein
MTELKITEVEVAKELPGWQGKGAKVFRYTVEGDPRRPEDFVPNDREPKSVGDTIPGIEDSEYGPKVEKARKQGGGGFQKSPAQELRIIRQHSQEQACRVQQTLGRVLDEQSFLNLVNWFVADAYRKDKGQVTAWPMSSDVPGDLSDTPFE